MSDTREDLRRDLTATLYASRELMPDVDSVLVDAFLDRVERTYAAKPRPRQREGFSGGTSLVVVGALWGTLAALLIPTSLRVYSASRDVVGLLFDLILLVLIVLLAVALSRAILYVGRHGWQVPRLRITLSPIQDDGP